MKKQLWIFGIAAVCMLSGCSGDDDALSSGSTAGNNGDGLGMDSNVEIRLSSKGGGTRSSLDSDDAGLFAANGLGIFCLANGVLSVNPNEQPIDWTPSSNTNYSVWLDNIEANAVNEVGGGDNTIATNIVWADGVTRWYPVGNWYNYHFYGYYPRVSDDYITASAKQRIASIPLDGTQDVIWGRTVSDDPLAFCAKYFRQKEHDGEVPGIAFKHKLMRLTFSCVPGVDSNGSIESALQMGVKSIAIKSVPSVANLVVADCTVGSSEEGTVLYDWTSGLVDFMLKDSADVEFGENHWVQETETTLGQGILLPVPDAATMSGYRYLVEIVLKDKSGNEFVSEHPIELQNTANYEAGKSYNVKLTVNGPQEIYLNAKLDKWVIDNDNIHDVTL